MQSVTLSAASLVGPLPELDSYKGNAYLHK